MNFREGTRRLALLLGVAGLLFGCFVSYLQVQSTMRQRAEHQRFEHLANSQIAKQDRVEIQQFIPTPTEDGPVTMTGPDGKTYHFPEGTNKESATAYFGLEGKGPHSSAIDDPIHKDGIEVIHWTKNLNVASIDTQDGQTLYPTPAPGAGSYLLICILPLLGFFIPWGAIRAIGWVGAGFSLVSK